MKRATVYLVIFHAVPAISIHALVKRATAMAIIDKSFPDISIHALVKRATRGRNKINCCSTNFNPRPREEGDLLCVECNEELKEISIHALVKRATK